MSDGGGSWKRRADENVLSILAANLGFNKERTLRQSRSAVGWLTPVVGQDPRG
jgi:hypothetical protein